MNRDSQVRKAADFFPRSKKLIVFLKRSWSSFPHKLSTLDRCGSKQQFKNCSWV